MQVRTKLAEFRTINKNSVSDMTVVWASIKGFLRNNAIQFSLHLHKTRLQRSLPLKNNVGHWRTKL